MSRLRQKLFEQYDQHYLRGNSLRKETVDAAEYEKHMANYECEFASLLERAPQSGSILDIGCGMGFLLYWLSRTRSQRFSFAGVDLSESQLAFARKHLPPTVQVMSGAGAAYLREHPRQFAVIFSTDVLEHLENDDELLELLELARDALVPGGLFICRVPNMANLTGSNIRYIDMTHSRGFNSNSIVQLLEAVGFCKVWIEPRRAEDASQWLRLFLEHWLHRIVFRICGGNRQRHFTRTLTAVGQVE